MIEIISGSTNKPISSLMLSNIFKSQINIDGHLYVGYPIFSTPKGRFPIDAILICPKKGVVLFHIVEGTTLSENYKEKQDDIYNKLEAKLRNHMSLMQRRKLCVPIKVVTFAPAVNNLATTDEDYPVCRESNLLKTINNFPNEKFPFYKQLLSVIQSISTIRKGIKKRNIQKAESRGAKLQKLEDSIANLDNQQAQAVIESVDSVQRIRGLAGSGKTIVLALKVAYLHAQHPEWKIVVTFNTRSLKGQFRQLINTFTIEKTGEEPDWDNLRIIHAWGSPGGGEREGIYYNFCKTHEIEYLDYSGARKQFGQGNEFKGACQKALDSIQNKRIPIYDAIMIDEAQDFPPSFLRICYSMLGDKKRLVYAYDELQSLNAQSLPSPEKIFGKNSTGVPFVNLKDKSQDIILEKCYRNSRPVLTTAHALGFGVYRDVDIKTGTGLIQMFENNQLWKNVGYSIIDGRLEDGQDVTLERTKNSSPKFLENHSKIDDLIQFIVFNTEEEQKDWIVGDIQNNLTNEELRVDDMIVINPDPLKTKNAVGLIRAELFKQKINSHLAGVDTTPDTFFLPKDNSIAFTGIYRAKGNEAGMVYIINAQDCYDSFGSLSTVRNQLFTAITRSKAWVRVLGFGENMIKLKKEFEKAKQHDFRLSFRYPTRKEREKLNIVNRDMTYEEKSKIRVADSNLSELVKSIDSGIIHIENLDENKINKLKELLTNEG